MFKKYIEYVKDNPQGYWFKAKVFGWGWFPVRWQGWLTLFIYFVLVFLLAFIQEESIAGNPDSGSNFLVFGLPIIFLTAVLIRICYLKGEKPRWQWGIPKYRQIKEEFRNKGFTHIYEWTDTPSTEYPEHSHKGKVSLYITDGSIAMNINGKIINLQKDDKYDVPVGIPHTAKVGPDGCSFVVGEEIKGDS